MRGWRIALVIVPIAMAACESTPPYIREARQRFDEKFICEHNATEEYVMCSYRPEPTALSTMPQIAFFVWDVAAKEILFEQSNVHGSSGWVDDFEIEMTLIPGIVTEEERGAPIFRIDVRTGNRRRVQAGETPN